MTSNIVFTKGSTVVTLFTSAVDESYTKILAVINPAVGSASYENGPKDKMLVDLLRIIHRFEIDGYIVSTEGTYGQSDTSSTVAGKKTDLIAIFQGGGVFTMNYSGTNYAVNTEKLSIKEITEDSDTVTRLEIKMSIIEGVNI